MTLTVTFFTPAFPKDLDLLSRPVTYLTFTVTGEGAHDVTLLIDVDPLIAVNTRDEEVTWGRSRIPGLTVLNAGSREQRVLNRPGDDLRIDWGYFHLAVPDPAVPGSEAQVAVSSDAMRSFSATGSLPASDDMDMPRMPRDHAAHLAAAFPLGKVSATPVTRHVLLAYTEGYAIEYLGRKLRPYWQRNNTTVQQMLADAESQYPALLSRGETFDRELTADLTKAGGTAYAQLAILAYRQTLAAHGFAADVDGTPMLFPKENFSNGCISTVDVLYPSAPFFLFFNPALIEAQLKPVLEYAALPRWKWPFAPHDLGTYPLANGQVYGGGETHRREPDARRGERQPAHPGRRHEPGAGQLGFCARLLAAVHQVGRVSARQGPRSRQSAFHRRLCRTSRAQRRISPSRPSKASPPMRRWRTALGKPEVAEGVLASCRGDGGQVADHGRRRRPLQTSLRQARHMEPEIQPRVGPDPRSSAFSRPRCARPKSLSISSTSIVYGLPLDNRRDYTKLDWEIWTATLADAPQPGNMPPTIDAFAALVAPIGRWINEGPTRVPLTDWYDTKTGKQMGFQARSVVGGVYIKALADRALAAKWRNRIDP